MNINNEIEEVGDLQDKIKNQQDMILDRYKNNPEKYDELLIEINSIDEDLQLLGEEFKKIKDEIC
jgi:division protein CdvB (Snf7/Vps24/ESCRT-III family)